MQGPLEFITSVMHATLKDDTTEVVNSNKMASKMAFRTSLYFFIVLRDSRQSIIYPATAAK